MTAAKAIARASRPTATAGRGRAAAAGTAEIGTAPTDATTLATRPATGHPDQAAMVRNAGPGAARKAVAVGTAARAIAPAASVAGAPVGKGPAVIVRADSVTGGAADIGATGPAAGIVAGCG